MHSVYCLMVIIDNDSMVVKILSSAGSFSGVEYNETKVSAGSAELLSAENFGLLEFDHNTESRTINEYQRFFKAWSTNERGRIEKPQFHAVISCLGRERSGEELKEIAEQFLEKMGYKDNPYLIYFHKDTANNHVHVVSSRVNEFGLKINDSFEYRRSQAVMKKILGQDAGQEVSEEVKKAMGYNFSSEAQFKMILEGKGITIKTKDNQFQFISAGAVAYEVGKELIEKRIQAYQEPAARVKQLKELFKKYKPALGSEKFSEFMKDKFGVELVFHTAKGKETPYGYSIMDHSKKQVLKGSQVMPLSAFLSLAPREEILQAGGELISTLAENDKLRYREFKEQLAKLGFELNSTGQVTIAGEEKVSFTIIKERMKQVMYNARLYEAQKFTIRTAAEAEVIRRVMFLIKEDMALLNHQAPGAADNSGQRILSDKLNSLLATGKELADIAKENNYVFAKHGSITFLIDYKNYALYDMAALTNRPLDYSEVGIIEADRANRSEQGRQVEYTASTFAEVAGIFIDMLESNSENQEQEKRRKMKRND
jgi:hypothetical protein